MDNVNFLELSESGERAVLAQLCSVLPRLPSLLRYHDEFTDSIHSIRDPEKSSAFELRVYGESRILHFTKLTPECALIFKHVFAFIISQGLSIGTAYNYVYYAHELTPENIVSLVTARPTGIGVVWKFLRGLELQPQAYKAAKSLLHLLCTYRLHGWSYDYRAFISTALPLPVVDKYAAVRSGDVFLSPDEEALIVRHLDIMTERIRGLQFIRHKEIESAGMLLCAYQFAMRPVQIGMLDLKHVRIWNDETSAEQSVHLTFHMAKQRGATNRIPLTRRVKREWVPIFSNIHARLNKPIQDLYILGNYFFCILSARLLRSVIMVFVTLRVICQ